MENHAVHHYKRVLAELSTIVGFKEVDALSSGAKLRVDENFTVSFLFEEPLSSDHLLVYIDLGPTTGHGDGAFAQLMKVNFHILAGARGTLSLHPESGHLFFSFSFLLDQSASGEKLLEHILRSVAWLGHGVADVHATSAKDVDVDLKGLATAGRARAVRLMRKLDASDRPE